MPGQLLTTLSPRQSVDLTNGRPAANNHDRSDFCQVQRAVPIVEAMVAILLAEALSENCGGASLVEMRPRPDAMRRRMIEDLPMDGVAWLCGYHT